MKLILSSYFLLAYINTNDIHLAGSSDVLCISFQSVSHLCYRQTNYAFLKKNVFVLDIPRIGIG